MSSSVTFMEAGSLSADMLYVWVVGWWVGV